MDRGSDKPVDCGNDWFGDRDRYRRDYCSGPHGTAVRLGGLCAADGSRRAAGREVVKSIIVHDGRPQREDRHRSFVDDINQGQMEAFISTPGCRRAVIAAFMDGVAGERCKDIVGAELCDQCEASRLTSDGGVRVRARARQKRMGRVATRTTGQGARGLEGIRHRGGHADQDAAPVARRSRGRVSSVSYPALL